MLNNPDFYPTPINLIHKMLGKLDFRYIKSVLEPSGGKGDLLDAITKQFSYNSRKDKKHDIDTIEIDKDLQHILKGKGYRLVHDDYLTYQSYKRYDAIIANFPFSQGDKHLLKAIEMQSKGGDIVALINAETLNNPYTNTRKELVQKLEDLNADIEYIDSAFINSERSTNVTVALIHISIPKNDYNSVILDELKKEELQESNKDYSSRELVDSDFVKGIVQQYNYEIKAGLKLIDEYNSLKPFMLDSFKDSSSSVLKLEINGRSNDDNDSLENSYIKQIRSKYWKTLFTNEQFIGLFTSNLRQKYMEQIDELKNYDFSLYNIYSLRSQLSQEMIQGVEDTILNLFEEFSHKHYYDETSKNIHLYNGWKTNKSYKVNKKVIIPLNGFNGWFDGSYRPTDYKVLDKLKDMEKVFNYLDGGLTEEIDITDTLKMAEHYQESRKIDLKYFFITFYKKGTCHIEFKNEDLLHKFNLYAAKSKMWLPPSYGNVKYKDMTSEEKEVINQFEGEKSYNKVINNKQYYIVDSGELLKLAEGTQTAV